MLTNFSLFFKKKKRTPIFNHPAFRNAGKNFLINTQQKPLVKISLNSLPEDVCTYRGGGGVISPPPPHPYRMSPYFSRDIYVRNKKLDVSPNGESVIYIAGILLQSF